MFAATEIGATGDFDFEVFYQKNSTPAGDKKDEINPDTTNPEYGKESADCCCCGIWYSGI